MNSNWRNQVSSVMLTKMIILHHLYVSLVSSFRVPSVSPTLVTGRHFTMVAGVSSFTCLKTELKIPEFVPRQVCGEKRLETWTVYWGLLFSTTLPLHRQPACFPGIQDHLLAMLCSSTLVQLKMTYFTFQWSPFFYIPANPDPVKENQISSDPGHLNSDHITNNEVSITTEQIGWSIWRSSDNSYEEKTNGTEMPWDHKDREKPYSEELEPSPNSAMPGEAWWPFS